MADGGVAVGVVAVAAVLVEGGPGEEEEHR